MKVILQKDVKDLGKIGDLVNVANGFARNFLFPRKLAMEATAKSIRQADHLKKVAESKKKKALAERKQLLEKLSGLILSFQVPAADTDRIFGSVTNADLARKLEEKGFAVDKRDIHLPEAIKMLGQYKAVVRLGAGLETEVLVAVERMA